MCLNICYCMELIITIVLLVVGIVLLTKSADWLVDSSVDIAYHLKIAPIYVGLTVVAFGTSLPELVVSLFAAYRSSTEIILGNVIGSNIANIGLFIGIAAVIFPLALSKRTLQIDFPMMLGISFLFFFLALTGSFGLIKGIILLAAFVAFLWYVFMSSKPTKSPHPQHTMVRNVAFVILGSIGLYFGGKLLVENAVLLARYFGMSELIIGLTIVAVGTSAPEIFVGISAALRKHVGLIIGNVIGSNIFNIGWVFGVISLFWEIPVASLVLYDIAIMLVFSVVLYIFAFTSKVIARWEGVVLLVLYSAYIVYLFI